MKPFSAKLLVVTLCFVSEFFPGSTSDKEITIQSGFLHKLEANDKVCGSRIMKKPAFLEKKKQFSKEDSHHNKVVASLRLHVERLMERIKN